MAASRAVIGVVGAGTMGAGIAQLALEAGHEVVLNDVDEEALERGRSRIRQGLARRAAKLDLDADSIDDWVDGRLAGLREAVSLDALGAEAEVIVEAALEDLDLKRTIFAVLDAAAPPESILATNTSALSVAAIAEATNRPERVLGLHFFNPAPIMPLVEVVSAPATDPAVAAGAAALVERWGKMAVRCADTPGFIVNRVNRPFTLEALAILEEGAASVEAIDAAVMAEGFPMGPFELMDLVGIDVNLAAARGVWEGLGRPDRLRPSSIQERLVNEGRLGRKTGAGFYVYDDGRRVSVADEFATGSSTIGSSTLGDDAIAERILLAVVNEAWYALGDRVATKTDIDLALRLGAGHPIGPFERTDRLGGSVAIVAALESLAASGDRFLPAPSLGGD
jgi:3-hydroxybutyryl-CoA dehydrogenase